MRIGGSGHQLHPSVDSYPRPWAMVTEKLQPQGSMQWRRGASTQRAARRPRRRRGWASGGRAGRCDPAASPCPSTSAGTQGSLSALLATAGLSSQPKRSCHCGEAL